MAFPFMALANIAGKVGQGLSQSAQSSARFDPVTGKSYSIAGETFKGGLGGILSPISYLSDPGYSTREKILGTALPFLKPVFAHERAKDEEKARIRALGNVRASLEATPKYESPEEVAQLKAATTAGAETMRGLGDEMIKVAQARRQSGVSGQEIRKSQLREYAQSAVDDFIETGGASASSLAAITQARQQQSQNMLSIAEQANSQSYADQQAYMSSLLGRAGVEAAATGLEGIGYQTGISEAEKKYQGRLERIIPRVQFEMTQYGNKLAQNI
jgi:hypothetical protein